MVYQSGLSLLGLQDSRRQVDLVEIGLLSLCHDGEAGSEAGNDESPNERGGTNATQNGLKPSAVGWRRRMLPSLRVLAIRGVVLYALAIRLCSLLCHSSPDHNTTNSRNMNGRLRLNEKQRYLHHVCIHRQCLGAYFCPMTSSISYSSSPLFRGFSFTSGSTLQGFDVATTNRPQDTTSGGHGILQATALHFFYKLFPRARGATF